MHLIVDKARDEITVVEWDSRPLRHSNTLCFSSRLGQKLMRMAYLRENNTVEYASAMTALMQARAAYDATNVQLQLGS